MLNKSCDQLTGVGPILGKKLQRCGIHTLQDLLFYLPFRYQDRTRVTAIRDIRLHDWCVVVGKVIKVEVTFGRRMSLICFLEDKSGIIKFRFFHFNKHQAAQLREQPLIRAFGEIRMHANTYEMVHPEYQLLTDEDECHVEETLTPIYPSTQGLGQTRLRQLIQQVFTRYRSHLNVLEWMQSAELSKRELLPLDEALEQLHSPSPEHPVHTFDDGSHPALKRLVFDELMAKRLSLHYARGERARLKAPQLSEPNALITQFLSLLPFTLTEAQLRVYLEISEDLQATTPMLRLVQGDVGSGKTVVAALSALHAIANQYQVAFMAPTELLSEQHANTLSAWFAPLGISVVRLNGKMRVKPRREALQAIKTNTSQCVVGTHALFQEQVEFANLGLVIIDEQHRFGVEQRLQLQQKGEHQPSYTPHQLMMTATPIPRTLAMTQFAHMDLSTIDTLPPGRTPIITTLLNQTKRNQIVERLKLVLAEGRQAYWVCTLIEESDDLQCMAAIATTEQLRLQLPNFNIDMVHGRMKAAEKEAVMQAFKQGQIQLLVATTVIEVGVDVPNASLMIIENPERLGLSQLHQLRGRVGRGSMQSHCVLLYQAPLSFQAKERLSLMRETTDGFLLAEKDLELRGAGQLLGKQQTGYQSFKVARLPRDQALLADVAKRAAHLIETEAEVAEAITTRWLGAFESFLQV